MSSGPSLVRTPPRTTSLKQIPDALRSLWRACMPEMPDGDVSRSLAINFVGIASARDEQALRDVTDRLQRRTPCRAFLLLVDDTVREIGAEVSATTRCHGTTRDIVLEEIVIRLPESGFPQMPGLVRPLLENDLPNHLFWSSGWPRREQQFDDLAQLCDHVVVDSRRFQAPARELELLNARRGKGKRVTDMSWWRLRPWRRALAEAFERVVWRPGTATTGRIRHGQPGAAAALLLAGWLGNKLGAKMQFDDTGDPTAACPDGVCLRTDGFEIEIAAARQQITAHVTTPEHCYVPFKVPTSRGSDGDLLAASIDLG